MEKSENNLNNNDKMQKESKMDWRPVIVFYVKTSAWIILPLIVGLFVGKYIDQSAGGQTLFFALMMMVFGITCFGIYREIKNYKKDLDPSSHEATNGQVKKDGK